MFYRPQLASVSTAGSTARPGGVSIRGLLKLEKHSATVCTSASCSAELKLTSSSHTPERASGADRNTHSDTTQQSSTHFCDTHTLSLGSRALVLVFSVQVRFLLSFSLSFCSNLSSFLPASHHGPALPSVLHTEERNAPCSAFTRCQKLKRDKKILDSKKTPNHIVKVGAHKV